ncbi:YwdI family protein [Alkalicoccus daliensis]|uniref:YwdI family protein n=1 Tax=Alkalicoccus daliensis TaxID=745820 RepID=A0A1H0L0X0_9BACI|nr:YwdI family protein [Alkalicoccus daliensis]SDO61686.1 hypothetical protein SAMN04488053_12212 [Alkalicoccus daliensis]
MDIPAKLVIEKMEAELARLKASIDQPQKGSSYRDHAQSLKTYCDLLLETKHTGTYYKTENLQHASVEDIRPSQNPAAPVRQSPKKTSIYDEGDEPKSDSLLDF